MEDKTYSHIDIDLNYGLDRTQGRQGKHSQQMVCEHWKMYIYMLHPANISWGQHHGFFSFIYQKITFHWSFHLPLVLTCWCFDQWTLLNVKDFSKYIWNIGTFNYGKNHILEMLKLFPYCLSGWRDKHVTEIMKGVISM